MSIRKKLINKLQYTTQADDKESIQTMTNKPNDKNNQNILNNLSLGKATEYIDEYNASLLQAVPRSLNRDELNLKADALPFYGEDVWYGYEVSWLNPQGKPIVAVAEFRVPCDSPNIIESKSFKLYLNSLNQTVFDSMASVEACLVEDLSFIAGKTIQVKLFTVTQCEALAINHRSATCIDDLDITIKNYDFNREHLILKPHANTVEETLVSHLLKSNCLITNQPDWATVYISYTGNAICHEGLLKYLISFRQHNEFHEQCVERIFNDLLLRCSPEELTVYARYTRRGGLDINPFRSTNNRTAPFARTLRQ